MTTHKMNLPTELHTCYFEKNGKADVDVKLSVKAELEVAVEIWV